MPRGQVKWFDPKKGYGFLFGPDGHDVFVHYSHIQADGFRALKNGEWVDYELVEGDKGYQAREVCSCGMYSEPGSPPPDEAAPAEAPAEAADEATPAADQPDRARRERPGHAEAEGAPPFPSRGYEGIDD